MKDSPTTSTNSDDSDLNRLATDELKKLYLFIKEVGRDGRSLDEAMEKCRELDLDNHKIAELIHCEILSFEARDGVGGIRILCKNIIEK